MKLANTMNTVSYMYVRTMNKIRYIKKEIINK